MKKIDQNTALIYAGLLGLVLSDIIPTGGDALYFNKMRKWRNQLIKGEITPTQYWKKEALGYYTFNSGWWLGVGVITLCIKGDWKTKLKVLAGFAGAGVVAFTIIKNIKDDKDIFNNAKVITAMKTFKTEIDEQEAEGKLKKAQ